MYNKKCIYTRVGGLYFHGYIWGENITFQPIPCGAPNYNYLCPGSLTDLGENVKCCKHGSHLKSLLDRHYHNFYTALSSPIMLWVSSVKQYNVQRGTMIRVHSLWIMLTRYKKWLVCQKQISRAGTSNYIPWYPWDVIILVPALHTYIWHTNPQMSRGSCMCRKRAPRTVNCCVTSHVLTLSLLNIVCSGPCHLVAITGTTVLVPVILLKSATRLNMGWP